MIDDYGFDFAKQLLLFQQTKLTHIRHNGFAITKDDFVKKYPQAVQNCSKIGFYIAHDILKTLQKNDYIIQSEASALAVHEYFSKNACNILDLCAAPGGKSIYLKQLYLECGKQASITSCDIHTHRVELIKKYAKSAPCDLIVLQNDATVLKQDWLNAFDLVICDVPCSGIGTINSKPEISFYRLYDDINQLQSIQLKILSTAASYVKKDGELCYSTCTVLKSENDNIINEFLKNNSEFAIQKTLSLFPHTDNCDGFFVCKLKKIR